jgi:hypothetical protein
VQAVGVELVQPQRHAARLLAVVALGGLAVVGAQGDHRVFEPAGRGQAVEQLAKALVEQAQRVG